MDASEVILSRIGEEYQNLLDFITLLRVLPFQIYKGKPYSFVEVEEKREIMDGPYEGQTKIYKVTKVIWDNETWDFAELKEFTKDI